MAAVVFTFHFGELRTSFGSRHVFHDHAGKLCNSFDAIVVQFVSVVGRAMVIVVAAGEENEYGNVLLGRSAVVSLGR